VVWNYRKFNSLYVVDGVITSDITYLNNSDIAAVDILKDAASCAIYGINGANGVLLITTKSGKSGKKTGQITFDAYYGIQNVGRKADLLNAKEYATMQNEAAIVVVNYRFSRRHKLTPWHKGVQVCRLREPTG
jgi:TonB-dependent SusC/RagA subfamily outer membrane receptor